MNRQENTQLISKKKKYVFTFACSSLKVNTEASYIQHQFLPALTALQMTFLPDH